VEAVTAVGVEGQGEEDIDLFLDVCVQRDGTGRHTTPSLGSEQPCPSTWQMGKMMISCSLNGQRAVHMLHRQQRRLIFFMRRCMCIGVPALEGRLVDATGRV
jgi:hypothetical protein